MNKRFNRGAVLAAFAGGLLGSPLASAETPKTIQVDCSVPGKTIAKGLEKGKEDRALIIVVSGTCNENVVIDRADVTLLGLTGAAVNGPDALLNTIQIIADRVTIDNLIVSGGLNGIVANGAGRVSIRGTTAQFTGRTGIIFSGSSGGIIDASTAQLNPRDGVSVEGSQATIINSNVSQNARVGVFIGTGASVRVGLDNGNNAGASTVSQNGATGINVFAGGAAIITNNTITGNGTDPASTSGRSGIQVIQSTADIGGSNTIANNAGNGVFVRSGTAQIGNPSYGFSSVNTITGNGNPAQPGGVNAFLGSSLLIRDAVISGNVGVGVILSTRSNAQIFNTQVQGTVSTGPGTGDGIRLVLGSALLAGTPPSSVTGNAGAGFVCFGSSAAANTGLLGSAGNGASDIPCAGPL